MILVRCNDTSFQYDIHSLVKSFYPGCDVKVISEDEEEEKSSCCDQPELFICMHEDRIELSIYEGNKETDFRASYVNEGCDRSEYKNSLKLLIYDALCDYCHRSLPWGTLTGIRPTKIALSGLGESKSRDEILAHYRDVYKTSEKKAKLAVDIAGREKAILDRIHFKDGYSLYIGIPFCPSTCLYCSFTSFPRSLYEKKVAEYMKCLKAEIDYTAEAFKDRILDSIYVGGGTPTTLTAEELRELLGYIGSKIDLNTVQEFTVEAGRPDSITEEKLIALKDSKVSRISVNPQTFKQKTLDIIGRRHTVDQVIDTYKLARKLNFDNINMDLIAGLPGEDLGDMRNTLDIVRQLAPDSVTIHSLAIKRASRLKSYIDEHGIEMLNNTDEIMDTVENVLIQMGLNPYYLYRQKNMSGNFENVGYARPGKEGIYNMLIMEEVQSIVALGAGTVSKRVFPDGRIERCDNVKDVGLYIDQISDMIERKRKLFKNL